MTLQELKAHADALPPADRAELADYIWSSFDEPADDEEFNRELDRRLEDYKAGRLESYSLEETMAFLRRGKQ